MAVGNEFKNKFIEETLQHKSDLSYTFRYCIIPILEDNFGRHDDDKIDFRSLDDWKEYFRAGNHFTSNITSHHHKENVTNMFEVIEMLSDWVCASNRRTKLLNPNEINLPHLDWDQIMRNTLQILVEFWKKQ